MNDYLYIALGTKYTVTFFILSFTMCFLLSCYLFTLKFLFPRLTTRIINLYIGFFRSVPLLLQIFLATMFLGKYIHLGDQIWCLIVLACNSSAYLTSIFFDAFSSIPKSYLEVSYSLGFSKKQTLQEIIFPMVIKNARNSMDGEFMTLLKDTSIISLFGTADIFFRAKEISYATYDFFYPLCFAGIVFIIVNMFRKPLLNILISFLLRGVIVSL